MATILITGGTGLIGTALTTALLARQHHVIILTRSKQKQSSLSNLSYATWDISSMTIDETVFSKVTHIIHLAGAGIADKRWSAQRKKEILESRVRSCELIVQTLQQVPHQVEAVISSSAIGWYGADPVIPNPDPFREESQPANDFLGTTCASWEQHIDPVMQMGIRLVKLRTGIVLSKNGGALKEFITPLRFGLAAILGSGKQIISWIHIDDLVNLYITAVENDKMMGPYNAVAPYPVSNKELTMTLARNRQKFYIPVHIPSFVLKLVLGEMSIEVLKSATVSASKISGEGFIFQYPSIEAAIQKELHS